MIKKDTPFENNTNEKNMATHPLNYDNENEL